jgi:hypothetical protein
VYDCAKGRCQLKSGPPATLTLKYGNATELRFDSATFLTRVAESLKWSHDNLIESGFRIYSSGACGELRYDPLVHKMLQELEPQLTASEMNKIDRSRKQGKSRERALADMPNVVRGKLMKRAMDIGGGAVGLATANGHDDQISHYHSHPFTVGNSALGTGASDTDANNLRTFNTRDNFPKDHTREAYLSRPNVDKCAKLYRYSTDAAPTETGVTIIYDE